MHIIAAFEYCPQLEMALDKLEQNGISKEKIIAVPLDIRDESQQLLDSIHRTDGKSSLDIAFVLGMIFMLLGSIYGFVLAWGPILWGLIGLVVGFLLGLALELILNKRKKRQKKEQNKRITEVVLTIECTIEQRDTVEKILWDHYVIGIGRLE
ncbi:MAG: hypothetical protein LRY73_19230 [Bacillus sp. (in: Bacteria)]|nr:hypothetical protein [Bacillus sp. (in: firmicutes)]